MTEPVLDDCLIFDVNATELQHVNHRRRRSGNQPELHCHRTPRMFSLVSTVLWLFPGGSIRVHERDVSSDFSWLTVDRLDDGFEGSFVCCVPRLE